MKRARWDADLADCYARVLRGVAAVCGSLGLAEDSLQDALVAALQPGVIDTMERVDAWLFVAAVRGARRTRWRRRLEIGLQGLNLATSRPNENRLEIVRLIDMLPMRQREVIVARYYLGLSYAEIAAALGITTGGASSAATQALRRMRKELIGKGTPQWTGAK